MNGSEPQIEFIKPFNEAFELMKKILFQPFDFKKWLVIGFAAFLASLSGGFQFNGNPLSGWSSRGDRHEIAQSLNKIGPIGQLDWWIIALFLLAILFFIAFVLVIMWLGARGRFIFTDCIVRERAAIVAPWKEFRVEGNSFFLFTLLVGFWMVVLLIGLALALFLPITFHSDRSKSDVLFFVALGIFIFVVLSMIFGWAMISHVMVPIMYRQRCRARQAFSQGIRLVSDYPGPILLYVLFLIAIGIGAGLLSCVTICITCCIAAIPYVGSVILLPISVTLYAFTLLFLRQFGPDFDVWQRIPSAEPAPIPASPTPPIQSTPPPMPPELPA